MKIIGFIGLLLLPVFTNCQESDWRKSDGRIGWGKTISDSRRSQLAGVIGQFENKVYALRLDSDAPVVDILSDSLSILSSFELDLSYEDKEMRYEGIFLSKDQLILLSSFYNQKHKKHYLFARPHDANTLVPGELQKIAEVSDLSRKSSVYFDHDMSLDGSKILIYYSISIQNIESVRFGFKVLNTNLEELWEKSTSEPGDMLLFNPTQIEVANNGNVLVSGTISDRGRGLNESKNKHHILLYQNAGARKKDFEIVLEDKFVQQMIFNLDWNNNAYCSGFYTVEPGDKIDGLFYIKINSDESEVISKTYHTFSEEFISGNSDSITTSLENKPLVNYRIRDILIDKSNGIKLIAEQYYIEVDRTDPYNYQNVRTSRSITHYFFNDILVFNLTEAGDLNWQTRIRKNQHSTDDGGYFSSFFTTSVDGTTYIMYNESARDFHTSETYGTLEKSEKRSEYLVVTRLAENGSFTKRVLLDDEEIDVRVRPKVCVQLDSNSALIYGKWNKKQRYGRLVFERSDL